MTSLATCTDEEIAAQEALPVYETSEMQGIVRVEDGQLALGDEVYFARGINYYPSRYPWRRFLTQTDMVTIDDEFALLQEASLNTLRIFLWNDALFTCFGSGAIPVAEAFTRLDGIIQRAAEYGFRLIVTLNDMPDLGDYPLYSNPSYIEAQTRFIIERYRDESAILAWDLRNEGDIDYGSHSAFPAKFSREVVLRWLEQTAAAVRTLDPNHLLTAGWLYDNEATIPYVDFISFHHWGGAPEAQERIFALQNATDKPVLMQEFGYSTQRMGLEDQARTISDVIEVAEATGAAGWLIWTAFDFPTDATCVMPNCPSPDNAEHHFGLWYSDYTPKPTVAVLTS